MKKKTKIIPPLPQLMSKLYYGFVLMALMLANTCFANNQNCYSDHELQNDIDQIVTFFNLSSYADADSVKLEQYITDQLYQKYNTEKQQLVKDLLLEDYYTEKNDLISATEIRINLLINHAPCLNEKKLYRLNAEVGNFYSSNGNYFLANYFHFKSLEFKTESHCKTYDKIGLCYFHLEMYDSAAAFFQDAVDCSVNDIDKIRNLNHMGYSFYKAGAIKNAEGAYNEAVKIYKTNSKINEFQYLNLNSNIASCKIKGKKYGEAELILKAILTSSYYQNMTDKDFQFEIVYKLSQVYFYRGNHKLYHETTLKLQNYSIKRNTNHYRLLETNVNHEILFGNKNSINQAIKKLEERKKIDRIKNKKEVMNTIEWSQMMSEKNFELLSSHLKLKEERNASIAQSNRLYKLTLFAGILIFIMGGIILRHFYQKHKEKREIEQIRMENKELKIQEQMQLIKERIQFLRSNREVYEMLLKKLEYFRETEVVDELNNLIFFIKSLMQTEIKKEKLLNQIDANLIIEFNERVKKRHSNLTNVDLEIITLINLGMSNKEMAIFRNVEPHSIRVFKNRLKQKLTLTKDQDLAEYINSL